MTECDVGIVGGGVAGAAAACAFAVGGVSVVLFERRDLARDPNRGDVLHPGTLAILERLGVVPLLRERGAFDSRYLTFTDATGLLAARFATRRHPTLILNHAEIESALLEFAVARGAAVRSEAVRAVVRSDRRWSIETDAGPTVAARLLVGADGAGSLVRRTAEIPITRRDYEHSVVVLHAPRPAWVRPRTTRLMALRKGALLLAPTTPEGRYRIVFAVPADEAGSWLSATDAELGHRLAARHRRLGELAIERRGGSHVYRLARQHAQRYVDRNLAVIGDAANVTHPFGGQGMNLAIADADALARSATPVLRDGASEDALDAALAGYQRQRWQRNARALARADAGARLGAPGWATYALSTAILAAATPIPVLPWRLAFPL